MDDELPFFPPEDSSSLRTKLKFPDMPKGPDEIQEGQTGFPMIFSFRRNKGGH